jgi:beta-glucuronidase
MSLKMSDFSYAGSFSRTTIFTFLALFGYIFSFSGILAQTASLQATLSLKQVDGVMIPYQNGFALPSFEKQNRKIIDLQGEWRKQRFSASDNITLTQRDTAGYADLIDEADGRHRALFDDGGWETKILPAVENKMNAYPTVPEYYQDGVWYRRSFQVDNADSGKFVKLNFYAVNYIADVWLNDVYLGYHEGGYTPFSFDVSTALNYGDTNILAVRVDNPRWGGRRDIVPYANCDWFNYTGIFHDVYLEFSSPVSVIRNDIVPLNLDGLVQSTIVINNIKSSDVNIDASIQVFKASIDSTNFGTEFSYQLISGNDVAWMQTSITVPAESIRVYRTTLLIANPKLWTPKEPNLYIMKVTIKEESEIIDEFSSQFGLRTVKTKGNKFLLNNKVVFFTGIARHEDHPVYGRSLPKDIILSDLQLVKNANVNFLRTAHYPNHPYTYLISDRLGLTVLEEIPVWWFDTQEAWQIQNNARHIHKQMFREMVFKDFNRPSIILWSACNECLDVPNRKVFIETVNQDLDTNYPDARLITQSAAADRPGADDDSQNACDVCGWTMYFGIFHGSTYFSGTYNFLKNAQANFPAKPIIDTEFGYWSSEDNSSEQKQIDVFKDTFLAFQQYSALNSKGAVNGNGALLTCTWWCVFDWYSHQHSQGFQSMGLYSMDRSRAKPVAAVLKASYLPYYNFDGVLTDFETDKEALPNSIALMQNYPNPFNSRTVVSYYLPVRSSIKLELYNSLGQKIATLVNAPQPAGYHQAPFNGDSLSSGVYYYRLEAANFILVKKMLLLK